VQFLDLRGPGTAIVAIDDSGKTAYIIDGGKSGNRGISGALLDGHHLLDALLQRKIERVVITCSHPHSDHLDGLLELVRDPKMGDPQFREVHFVDSDYPAESRLFESYQERWPPGQIPDRVVAYHSARGVDALGLLTGPDARVVAHNFRYDPPEAAAHPHGRCVITQMELRRGGETTHVVDFDDANDGLVRQWAEWAKADPAARRPGVIVLPHHGSAHSDITPLLDESIRPRSAVITVNPDNQYRHPGPGTLRDLVRSLGPENVHFTGRSADIKLDERGMAPRPDPARLRLDYELFLKRAALDVDAEILELEDRPSPTPDDQAKLGRLRETRKTYSDLERAMTADPEAEAAQRARIKAILNTWIERMSGRSFGFRMPSSPDPDTPLNPFLEDQEKQAADHLKSEADASRRLRAVRKALRKKQYSEATRLASEGLEQKGWTAREFQALTRLAAAEPLLTGREVNLGQRGDRASAIPEALLWPEIAGPQGADALRRYALRESRDVLNTPENATTERLRWAIDALERSGGHLEPTGRQLVEALQFRLLLEGHIGEADIRAVGSMSPEQAAVQLQAFKATLGGETTPGNLGRGNPLLRDLPVSREERLAFSPSTAELIRAIDVQLAGDGADGVRRDPQIDARPAAEGLLREIDAVITLHENEIALRDRLAQSAEGVLKEPLLTSEKLTLREKFGAGSSLLDAIKEIRRSREKTLELVRVMSPEKGKSIGWRKMPSLKLRDIGLTPEVIARRQVEAMTRPGVGSLSSGPKPGKLREIGRETDMKKVGETIRKMERGRIEDTTDYMYHRRVNETIREIMRGRIEWVVPPTAPLVQEFVPPIAPPVQEFIPPIAPPVQEFVPPTAPPVEVLVP